MRAAVIHEHGGPEQLVYESNYPDPTPAEGEVIVKDLTLEQSQARAKHMAEDAGKEFDPASVTEPMTIVMLDGKGATISVKS